MSLPRKYPPPIQPDDWNAMVDRINGLVPTGYFTSPYSFLIATAVVGGVTYYYANNAFQTVYGGHNWAVVSPTVNGTDLAAVVQAAINAGSTVVFGDGTFTFTVAKYSPGDATYKIGCYLKDNVHVIISKGATITQANGLKLQVFFAGHLWGTGSGEQLSGVTFEVYGMIDGNYGNQSYTVPDTAFEACPIALYATKSSFPIIRAKEFGRYGALVLYGAYNQIGEVYAETSYDVTHHQASGVDLERCEETNFGRVIGAYLDGRGVQIADGGSNIIIEAINTYNCYGNLLICVASALAVKGISVGKVVSGGHYTSGGYGAILITAGDGFGGVSDIAIDSASISGASDDGIKIVNFGTPHTAVVRRVTIGSAILYNNHQHGGDGGLALAHCNNVTIGFLHAYDDQGVKTQYWGIKLGDEVTGLLINGGSVAGNVDTVDGYTTAKGKILNVVAFLTMNHGATTGTGARQTIAHGLGATPSYIRFWDYAGNDRANVYLDLASDTTNIYPLAVLNKIYLWEAYI